MVHRRLSPRANCAGSQLPRKPPGPASRSTRTTASPGRGSRMTRASRWWRSPRASFSSAISVASSWPSASCSWWPSRSRCRAAFLMADDVSHTTEWLRQEAERIASGDLTRGEVRESEDELGDLARSFEGMTDSLRATVGRVADAAERVDAEATAIAKVGSSVASATGDQVQGIKQASGSMAAINAQVSGIARLGPGAERKRGGGEQFDSRARCRRRAAQPDRLLAHPSDRQRQQLDRGDDPERSPGLREHRGARRRGLRDLCVDGPDGGFDAAGRPRRNRDRSPLLPGGLSGRERSRAGATDHRGHGCDPGGDEQRRYRDPRPRRPRPGDRSHRRRDRRRGRRDQLARLERRHHRGSGGRPGPRVSRSWRTRSRTSPIGCWPAPRRSAH